jgi:carboxypeptidase C (cathepsin A)
MRFCKELLRDQKRTVGRLDSRFKGLDALEVSEFPDFDPSMLGIMPPYTATFNHYVRTELGYETDIEYRALSFEVNSAWEWEAGKFPDTSEALRSAVAKNPHMKLFLGLGIYDLATAYFATLYTINHMDLDPSVRENIHMSEYEAGHMFYVDVKSLAKLKMDISQFFQIAL